jgi:hypothetical protein
MERVLTKCDLTRYLPSAAPSDNNPSELALTADDAADQIRSISQIEFKRTPYVLRVFFETLIFEDEVVIELVHTHYWTKQYGSKVDLGINNLCMYVLLQVFWTRFFVNSL